MRPLPVTLRTPHTLSLCRAVTNKACLFTGHAHMCKKRLPHRDEPWTLRDYAAFATSRGGRLLTKGKRTDVPRASDRLYFRCDFGHEWEPAASAARLHSHWCFKCARGGHRTWTIADFHAHAKSKAGRCFDNRPKLFRPLAIDRVSFRCSEGHTWDTNALAVQRNLSWCRICTRTADPWDAARYSEYATTRGGILLSRHPSGVIEHATPISFQCAKGHKWTTTAGQIKSYATWCWTCGHEGRKKPLTDLIEIASSRGGELLAAAKNRMLPFAWKCCRGHVFERRPAEVTKGFWCPRCSTSLSERIVRAHFEQIFKRPFPRVRPSWLQNSTGHALELDGFCEDLSLAFEHQGDQHYREVSFFGNHSLASIRKRDSHKRRLCRKREIRLIELPALFSQLSVDSLHSFIIAQCKAAGVALPKYAARRKVSLTAVYSTTQDDEALAVLHAIAKRRGGRCLAKDYRGSNSRTTFECDKGHRWSPRVADVIGGSWCKQCAVNAIADRKRLTIELMHKLAAARGGTCLSKVYVDTRTPLRWQCGTCGQEWESTPTSIQRGSWCQPCGWKAGWDRRRRRFGKGGGNKGKLKYTIDDMQRLARRRGGKCLSTRFVGVQKHHKWQCRRCGNEWMAAPSDVLKGTWCQPCSTRLRWARHRASQRQGK